MTRARDLRSARVPLIIGCPVVNPAVRWCTVQHARSHPVTNGRSASAAGDGGAPPVGSARGHNCYTAPGTGRTLHSDLSQQTRNHLFSVLNWEQAVLSTVTVTGACCYPTAELKLLSNQLRRPEFGLDFESKMLKRIGVC